MIIDVVILILAISLGLLLGSFLVLNIIPGMKAHVAMSPYQRDKLRALEEHFGVAQPAGRDANCISGLKCFDCGGKYSIDEDYPSDTIVCPHCSKVSTNFAKVD